jgi:hypothetical protein
VSDIRVPGAPHGAAARETMTTALVVALVIFAGTLASLEAGFRWGRRETARNTAAHEGIGAVEASAFALLGLLLGFSFAGATARLEAKRELIVAEANAIGTAYRRLDTLPPEAQASIREQFKRLIDARIRAYERRSDPAGADRDLEVFNAAWTESGRSRSKPVRPRKNGIAGASGDQRDDRRQHRQDGDATGPSSRYDQTGGRRQRTWE